MHFAEARFLVRIFYSAFHALLFLAILLGASRCVGLSFFRALEIEKHVSTSFWCSEVGGGCQCAEWRGVDGLQQRQKRT